MFTLDYLCTTQEGIPYNDVAEYIVPQIKEIGEEGFIKRHLDLGHSLKDVTDWVAYGRFSEKNLNRKLDFNQIKKTMEMVKSPVERYGLLFQNKNPASVVIAESTTEIETLKVAEAVMRMELADQTALVFRSSVHGGLNVVYRRGDGNLGWIDPADYIIQTR
ncbi:MAG: sigma 54 modulation/S30EA ribosomal C-terminal domain-containing protein, partial [Nitrospinae bacterium]|nr:sigma 54 modulation/S30EA ribosomal C-terminal domain-containing protein [Nitrospinota bacterium]